ncbi:MAG TPA: site-2 protease family protein [Actinobacteria bacterium]|nr:site-2 protease family protein [Actinomycetota bacterium]
MTVLQIAVAILVGFTFHEFAHAAVANMLGDPTAKDQGRMTLNPLKHLDVLGTIMIFIARIGWGKPVPVNHSNLKNQTWGPVLVSVAGPFSNFLIAILAAWSLKNGLFTGLLGEFVYAIFLYNILLGVFNLLPIPPLDGSHIVSAILPPSLRESYESVGAYGIIIIFLGLYFLPGGFSFVFGPILEFFTALFLI